MSNIPFEKSFAIHTKAQYWSEKNGEVKPRDVFKSSGKKYMFKCGECNHEFQIGLDSISSGRWCSFCSSPPKNLCQDDVCLHCFNNSFASSDKAKYWSEKNGDIKPRDVFKSSGKKYMFKCGECNHEFKSGLNDISNGQWCPFCANKILCQDDDCLHCFNNSFANSDKAKYWSEKNGEVKPRDVAKSSGKKYMFKCGECNHEFEMILNNISSGKWCRFCSSQDCCKDLDCCHCFTNSFDSSDKAKYWSEKNGNIKPRDVFKSSNKKYWFKCGYCKHEFQGGLAHISYGQWCSFCSKKILCKDEHCHHCFDNSFVNTDKAKYWSEKNREVKPRDVFKSSNKKYLFNCEKCSHVFQSSLNNISSGTWCPNCVNKTEAKLLVYLMLIFPDILKQYRKDWCKNKSCLPFDFCIEELKIIIELDGAQHFRQVRTWKTHTETRRVDVFKMKCALENGYRVIRLLQEDVWENDEKWLDTHLKPLLTSEATFDVVYINSNDTYQAHIRDMENTPIIIFE